MNLYRRKLLALASAGMVAPHIFAASPPKGMYRIGYLTTGSQPKGADAFLETFKKRLQELGYVEGQNIVIAPRWADNNFRNLSGLITEMIALKPDVIVFTGDFVNLSNTDDPVAEGDIRALISQWSAPLGVYCVSGTPPAITSSCPSCMISSARCTIVGSASA